MMTISQQELFFKKEFSFKAYAELVRSVKVVDIKNLVSNWMKHADPTVLVLADKPRNKREWARIQTTAKRITSGGFAVERE